METLLLRDQQEFPTEEILRQILGNAFEAFDALMDAITLPEFGLVYEWNYYRDGKSWLCKVMHKKKTVFWLSVWDKFFKVGLYFTEKTIQGIENLDIDNCIKANSAQSRPVGRLIPLTVSVDSKEQLTDLLKIIAYKKSCK